MPALGLTAWARPGPPLKGSVFRPLARFAVPPTVFMAVIALAIHLLVRRHEIRQYLAAQSSASAQQAFDHALPSAQTATITFLILCSLILIAFVAPPTDAFTGGAPLRGDRRPAWMALGLLGVLVVVSALPLTRHLFELSVLDAWMYPALGAAAVLWALIVRWVWRRPWLDRLFGVSTDPHRVESAQTQITR